MISHDKQSAARRLCLDAVLLCTALLFSYVEALIPLSSFPALPGLKLGLCNIAVLLTALLCGIADAWAVSICRVLLSALLFGGVTTLLFSACGAFFSLLLITCLRRFCPASISITALCVASAAAHNIGQLLAASLLLSARAVLAYIPLLLIVAVPTGALTGIVTTWMHAILNRAKGGAV